VVEERTRIGDWEGDLIVGRFNRSAIGTLVDRRTGYLRLVHLPDGHSAERLRVALLPVLTDLPDLARQTLTWIRTRRWPAITCSRSTWPTASSSHRRPCPLDRALQHSTPPQRTRRTPADQPSGTNLMAGYT
jgi:hypothetical protein